MDTSTSHKPGSSQVGANTPQQAAAPRSQLIPPTTREKHVSRVVGALAKSKKRGLERLGQRTVLSKKSEFGGVRKKSKSGVTEAEPDVFDEDDDMDGAGLSISPKVLSDSNCPLEQLAESEPKRSKNTSPKLSARAHKRIGKKKKTSNTQATGNVKAGVSDGADPQDPIALAKHSVQKDPQKMLVDDEPDEKLQESFDPRKDPGDWKAEEYRFVISAYHAKWAELSKTLADQTWKIQQLENKRVQLRSQVASLQEQLEQQQVHVVSLDSYKLQLDDLKSKLEERDRELATMKSIVQEGDETIKIERIVIAKIEEKLGPMLDDRIKKLGLIGNKGGSAMGMDVEDPNPQKVQNKISTIFPSGAAPVWGDVEQIISKMSTKPQEKGWLIEQDHETPNRTHWRSEATKRLGFNPDEDVSIKYKGTHFFSGKVAWVKSDAGPYFALNREGIQWENLEPVPSSLKKLRKFIESPDKNKFQPWFIAYRVKGDTSRSKPLVYLQLRNVSDRINPPNTPCSASLARRGGYAEYMPGCCYVGCLEIEVGEKKWGGVENQWQISRPPQRPQQPKGKSKPKPPARQPTTSVAPSPWAARYNRDIYDYNILSGPPDWPSLTDINRKNFSHRSRYRPPQHQWYPPRW